jgi:hypothetical protein|tara:strand:+ start:1295 stop:1477 length:183 start_codon:yes stop_codon:yes gene_type:complete
MKKVITPLTFVIALLSGFIVNVQLIEALSITNFIDQILCTTLTATIFSCIAAAFKIDIPE